MTDANDMREKASVRSSHFFGQGGSKAMFGEGYCVQNFSDKVSKGWFRKSRVNFGKLGSENGRCSAEGNGSDGDTLSSFSETKDVRGSFQNFEFQKEENFAKGRPGGLQKEDGSDLSQMTGFKGPNKTQKFQLLKA
ncbi:hypothetical protein QYF36_008750 [Acer negundo]|nr:hypothetical protein QYF36_008750 [Acer negundo]